MSLQDTADLSLREAVPDFTPLGKRLEILRIERGVSKQRLARHAGTSRQQLWRVMTGKSELTSSLRDRLAFALSIEPSSLVHTNPDATHSVGSTSAASFALTPTLTGAPLSVSEYLTDPEHLAVTLRTLPMGDGGRRLKRALLNAVEDLAMDAGQALPVDYSEMRRRVLAGEL